MPLFLFVNTYFPLILHKELLPKQIFHACWYLYPFPIIIGWHFCRTRLIRIVYPFCTAWSIRIGDIFHQLPSAYSFKRAIILAIAHPCNPTIFASYTIMFEPWLPSYYFRHFCASTFIPILDNLFLLFFVEHDIINLSISSLNILWDEISQKFH